MNKFSYKAKDDRGETNKGTIEATDQKQAVKILREKGLTTYSLNPVRDNVGSDLFAKFFQRISLSDIATFTRQLSTMITAGMTINEGLSLLRMQSSPVFGAMIEDIQRSVEGGSSFSDALAKHRKVFGTVYISLVKAGEAGGVLDDVLLRLADNLEKSRELQGKIKGAMIYPTIIIIGMLGVVSIMMIFVIPKLLSLYTDMQIELPMPTKVLIAVSNFMVNYWYMLLAGIFIGIFAFRAFGKTEDGRRKIDSFKLSLPILGNIQKQSILAEMTRTLGLLVSTGISIIDALNIVSEGTGNVIFETDLKEVAKEVEKGLPIAVSIAAYDEFPPIIPQMISVGEETGKLDEVLKKLSKYFEAESEEMVKGLTTAIEPLIMIVLGVGVGFLIIAVVLPIYNLTSSF
jgi:type IV pilus assembly protein PilC